MKLIREYIEPTQIKPLILEETDSVSGQAVKSYYITGPFLCSEEKNKNGRIYKKPVLEREVTNFIADKIKNKRAGGELNHPESPIVNLDRISHYITELQCEGNNWIGKAKLANTPMGIIAQTLIKDGYSLGVSSRGLGDVADDGEVGENFKLVTIDLVSEPSAPNAFVHGIFENKTWLVGKHGEIFEAPMKNLEKKFKTIPKKQAEEYFTKAITEFLNELKSK